MPKLATYNVMSGGFDAYDPSLPAPQRLAKLQEAVRTINADLVGLTDTYRWHGLYSAEEVAAMFGYAHAALIDMRDERVDPQIGLCLLSNLPILKSRALRVATRDCLLATVEMEGKPVDVCLVYLDDLSEDTRIAQVTALLAGLSQNPTIIMGDLNCVSPDQAPAFRAALPGFRAANPAVSEPGNVDYFDKALAGMARAEALAPIYKAGFREIAEGAGTPTAITPLSKFGQAEPVFPIDHIFAAPSIALTDFTAHTGTDFDQASDHYPISVYATFAD
jgi:endonuclease/exonuclease/phosphatase family metal-dependent hydrolase